MDYHFCMGPGREYSLYRPSGRCRVMTGFAATMLVAFAVLIGCAHDEELSIASYNVENLFDDVYDGGEYRSFDPRGDDWGPNRYARSLEHTVRVIKDLGGGNGADILALQEIENQRVLEDLAGEIVRLGYTHRVLVENTGPFHNAIFSRFPVESVRTHALSLPWAAPGRYILEVDILWHERPLRFLVNHWHSKVGGERESERSRREAAGIVARRIRSTAAAGGPPVIVLGDLNVNADEYVRVEQAYPTALLPVRHLGRYDSSRALYLSGELADATVDDAGVVVYSPWKAGAQPGSYVYQGRWNTIDHILLGPGFSETGEFSVFMEPYLLDSRGAPRRWRSDIAAGYSDHLPVELVLRRE